MSLDELTRLDELRRYEPLEGDHDGSLKRLAELAARACHAPIGVISFVDDTHQRFLARWGTPGALGDAIPREQSVCTTTIEHPEAVLVIENLPLDPRFAKLPIVGALELAFYAGAPLVTPGGHVLGTVCVVDHRVRSLTPDERRLLTLVRDDIMELFEQRRELGELRRSEALRQEAVEALMASQRDLQRRIDLRTRDVEAAHQKAERIRARLVEAQRVAHVGSWEWDTASDEVTWSEELYRIYGLPIGAPLGGYQGFLSRVYPANLPATMQIIGAAIEKGTPFIYDHRIVRPDGSIRMLHTRGEAVAVDGKTVRLIGCCWDVTDLHVATEAAKRTSSLLEASLALTAEGILAVGLDGCPSAHNGQLVTLFGLPAQLDGDTLARIAGALAEPEELLARVRGLAPGDESRDTLTARDGRRIEARSRPQLFDGVVTGRVWSFRPLSDA